MITPAWKVHGAHNTCLLRLWHELEGQGITRGALTTAPKPPHTMCSTRPLPPGGSCLVSRLQVETQRHAEVKHLSWQAIGQAPTEGSSPTTLGWVQRKPLWGWQLVGGAMEGGNITFYWLIFF